MTQINHIIKFKFGHKEIQFPRKVLVYYPWLNDMFGGGNIGELKNELDYNIVDYLSNVNTSDIRCMLKSLLHLQNLYNEDDDEDTEEITMDTTIGGLYFNKDFYYTYFLDKTENFLKHGPGFTKGLDIPFVCTKCNAESYHPYMNKINSPPKHDIEIIGNMLALCKICGNTWSAHNQNLSLNIAQCCITHECIHDWK